MSVVKPVEATVSCVFTIVINLSLPGPARLPNPEGRDGVVCCIRTGLILFFKCEWPFAGNAVQLH